MTATVARPKPPKHIKVQTKRHPNDETIKFRLVQQIVWIVVGAAVGAFMVTAVYFWITQVHWTIDHHSLFYLRPGWNGLIKTGWWDSGRHDLRNCYEGVFGTLFAKSIITKRKYWGTRVPVWRVAISPLVILVAAFPIILLGIWFFDIRHGSASLPAQVHIYQSYVIGIIAGQVIHRLYAPVGNTVQLFFIEEAITANKRPRWPLPPIVRERYAWMIQTKAPVEQHGNWIRVVIPVMSVVMLWAAIYGGYVKEVIAKR